MPSLETQGARRAVWLVAKLAEGARLGLLGVGAASSGCARPNAPDAAAGASSPAELAEPPSTPGGGGVASKSNAQNLGTASPPAPNQESRSPLTSCAAAGPMACAPPPSPHVDLCQHGGRCMRSRISEDRRFDGLGFACDPDGPRGAVDPAFTARQPAPEGSGLEAITLMNAVAENDVGMIQFGATYLVAEFAEGSCLVDLVHDWDFRPSFVEADLAARWQRNDSGFRLHLDSRRILHEPLDESETSAGTPDVRSDVCVRVTYDVVDGRFARSERAVTSGACVGK